MCVYRYDVCKREMCIYRETFRFHFCVTIISNHLGWIQETSSNRRIQCFKFCSNAAYRKSELKYALKMFLVLVPYKDFSQGSDSTCSV